MENSQREHIHRSPSSGAFDQKEKGKKCHFALFLLFRKRQGNVPRGECSPDWPSCGCLPVLGSLSTLLHSLLSILYLYVLYRVSRKKITLLKFFENKSIWYLRTSLSTLLHIVYFLFFIYMHYTYISNILLLSFYLHFCFLCTYNQKALSSFEFILSITKYQIYIVQTH